MRSGLTLHTHDVAIAKSHGPSEAPAYVVKGRKIPADDQNQAPRARSST